MGEHFWPSVYPGLIVGLLCGQALGGRSALLFGVIGAYAAIAITPARALPTGTLGEFFSLALLIAMSATGAVLAIGVFRALGRPPGTRQD